MGTLSYVPPVVKSPTGEVKTFWRARGARFRPSRYGYRSPVESFHSGLKRSCGATPRGP
jgi:hypothetical protein